MAVTAIVAGGICGFAEVFQNVITQAGGSHAVAFHKLEAAGILALYLVDFLKIHALEVFASKKQFADHHILGGEEKNAFSWFAVSSGTSGFLVVVFHALRHVVMDDEAHVGLVNSHTKGICGDDYLSTVVDEIILAFLADIVAHSSVVTGYRDALFQ